MGWRDWVGGGLARNAGGTTFEVSFEGPRCVVLAWVSRRKDGTVVNHGEVKGTGYGLQALAAAIAGARKIGVEGFEVFVPGEVDGG